jgi:catechol 2,3-dioxygenase-like lactoylglutathione lyase family enzyme
MALGIGVSTVNISSSDPHALAEFYAALLGMTITTDEPDWVVIHGEASIPLAFELDERFVAPVWPSREGAPPTQMHLEVRVTDLEGALEHALACGARLADHQPQPDVRVCLDPAGHPFCLWLDQEELDEEEPAAGAADG